MWHVGSIRKSVGRIIAGGSNFSQIFIKFDQYDYLSKSMPIWSMSFVEVISRKLIEKTFGITV